MRQPAVVRVYQLLFRFGRRAVVRGFEVRVLRPQAAEWTLILARLDSALGLVAQYAPARYALLRRDIQRVLVTSMPARGTFVWHHAMCALDFDFVVAPTTTPAAVAMTLVHEGTHARLMRHGFSYDEAIRARIERLCIGSELVVARRLPDGAEVVRDAMDRLAWEDSTWSTRSVRERHLDEIRRAAWPGRLVAWLMRAVQPRNV